MQVYLQHKHMFMMQLFACWPAAAGRVKRQASVCDAEKVGQRQKPATEWIPAEARADGGVKHAAFTTVSHMLFKDGSAETTEVNNHMLWC